MDSGYDGNKTEDKKDKFVKKCVKINTAFKNMRIRHNLLIFGVIWGRFILGTFLNTLLLTRAPGLLFEKLTTAFLSFLHQLASQKFAIFNLILILTLIIILVVALVWQFRQAEDKYRIIIWISVIHYVINPVLIRYSIKLMTLMTHSKISYVWLFAKILAFIFVLLSCIHQILFYIMCSNPQTKNQNFLVRQRRFKMFFKEFNTFLLVIFGSVAFELSENTGEGGLVILVAHFLLSLIPLQTVCQTFLFHNQLVQIIFIVASCFELSLCFVGFLDSITYEPLIIENLQLVTITMTVFLFSGCREYIGYRNHKSILSDITDLDSDASLKLYAHIIAQSLLNAEDDNTKLQFITNSLKNQHLETCQQADCLCHKKMSNQQNRAELEEFLIKNKIKKIIAKGENNFELTLFCCYFQLTYFMAFPDLLYKLNQIRRREHLYFIQTIEYQCFKSDLKNFLDKKKLEMAAMETEKVQEQDHIILLISRTLEQMSSSKYMFWFSLGKKIPDFKVINESVKRQINLMNLIEELMPRILQEFIKSRIVLMFVCLYEIFIKIKSKVPEPIKEALRNYSYIRNEELKVMKKQKFKIESLMFEKVCVMFQSQIQKDNMGIILNVSKNITKVFGYTKQTIIGQNINEIMPKSMQRVHDEILQSWRERASWENIHKTRYIFAMTKDNVCFESAIYLRIVQRLESVNLLAAFMKVNENDYMIINEDGIIDGVGMSFKQALGFKVPKLPFEVICPKAPEIFALAKKGNTSSASSVFYHVKGLQSLIQAYQYSKYQLNNSTKDELTIEKVKTKERALNLSFEYRPYRMGSKFFVILKLIQLHKVPTDELQIDEQLHNNILIEQNKYGENESKANTVSMSCISKHTEQTEEHLNVYENNSSVNTSQHESNGSNDKVFTHLQQKFKQNHSFKCKPITNYKLALIGFSLLAISLIIIEYIYAKEMNKVINNHSEETFRLVERSNSLNLVFSRFQNIQHGFSDPQYQVMRALTEINRVEETIIKMELDLYQPSYLPFQDQLNMTVQWMREDNNKIQQILFDQQFTYFMIWCKDLEFKYILGNNQSIEEDFHEHSIAQNLMFVEKYIANNFKILNSNVIQFLASTNTFSKVKVGLLTLILVIIMFLLWKSREAQEQHHQNVLKVLLSISDRNCQHCGMYFRKITNILVTCREEAARMGNEAEYVEKELIDKTKLQAPLEQLDIQKDKFERNKDLKCQGYKKKNHRYIVVFIPFLFISFLIYTLVSETQMISNQITFIKNYFTFTKAQIQIVEYFLAAKSQALNYSYTTSSGINFNKSNEGMLNKIFLNFFDASQMIYTFTPQVAKFVGNLTLCQTIKNKDPIFYSQNCMQNSSFPYSRLKIYEVNSLIETYITNLVHQPTNQISNQTQKFSNLEILEQTVNLRYLSLCGMFDHFFQWLYSYRSYKMNTLLRVVVILISAVVLLVLIIWYFAAKICENMNKNCCTIIVIPELVLRCTKGAMRHVADVLNYLK